MTAIRRYTRYHFDCLRVGESIFIGDELGHGRSLASAAWHYAKVHPGYRFETRKVDGGYRCTRVEA